MDRYRVQIEIDGDNAWCLAKRDELSAKIATNHEGPEIPQVEAIGGSGSGTLRLTWAGLDAPGAWSAIDLAGNIVRKSVLGPDLLEAASVRTQAAAQVPSD